MDDLINALSRTVKSADEVLAACNQRRPVCRPPNLAAQLSELVDIAAKHLPAAPAPAVAAVGRLLAEFPKEDPHATSALLVLRDLPPAASSQQQHFVDAIELTLFMRAVDSSVAAAAAAAVAADGQDAAGQPPLLCRARREMAQLGTGTDADTDTNTDTDSDTDADAADQAKIARELCRIVATVARLAAVRGPAQAAVGMWIRGPELRAELRFLLHVLRSVWTGP